jgi:hypothetical protein
MLIMFILVVIVAFVLYRKYGRSSSRMGPLMIQGQGELMDPDSVLGNMD